MAWISKKMQEDKSGVAVELSPEEQFDTKIHNIAVKLSPDNVDKFIDELKKLINNIPDNLKLRKDTNEYNTKLVRVINDFIDGSTDQNSKSVMDVICNKDIFNENILVKWLTQNKYLFQLDDDKILKDNLKHKQKKYAPIFNYIICKYFENNDVKNIFTHLLNNIDINNVFILSVLRSCPNVTCDQSCTQILDDHVNHNVMLYTSIIKALMDFFITEIKNLLGYDGSKNKNLYDGSKNKNLVIGLYYYTINNDINKETIINWYIKLTTFNKAALQKQYIIDAIEADTYSNKIIKKKMNAIIENSKQKEPDINSKDIIKFNKNVQLDISMISKTTDIINKRQQELKLLSEPKGPKKESSPLQQLLLTSNENDFQIKFNKLFPQQNNQHFINWVYTNKNQNFTDIKRAETAYRQVHIITFRPSNGLFTRRDLTKEQILQM